MNTLLINIVVYLLHFHYRLTMVMKMVEIKYLLRKPMMYFVTEKYKQYSLSRKKDMKM